MKKTGMGTWYIDEGTKDSFLIVIKGFIDGLQKDEYYKDGFIDLTGLGVAPYHVWEVLEELGYKKTSSGESGWQMNFWLVFEKEGFETLVLDCCGMTGRIGLNHHCYF